MLELMAFFIHTIVLIAILPTAIFGLYYAHLLLYYGVQLGFRRREDAPLTWHDMWGILRFGQIMYPELLDNEGRVIREKMLTAIKRFLIAAAAAIALTALHEFAKAIALVNVV